jgi:hypothetical protein
VALIVVLGLLIAMLIVAATGGTSIGSERTFPAYPVYPYLF